MAVETSTYSTYPALVPELGNLAWAPSTKADRIDLLDRFNGVPSMGIVWVDGHPHLFWRALGYIGDLSTWLYVPLTPEDHESLEHAEAEHLLDGIVMRSHGWRYVAVGIAEENRLVFEREWQLPTDVDERSVIPMLADFVAEALRVALTQQPLPVSRRDVVQRASKAAERLASC